MTPKEEAIAKILNISDIIPYFLSICVVIIIVSFLLQDYKKNYNKIELLDFIFSIGFIFLVLYGIFVFMKDIALEQESSLTRFLFSGYGALYMPFIFILFVRSLFVIIARPPTSQSLQFTSSKKIDYTSIKPKKVFDKNNREIEVGDIVEISDEDMQQIQNQFEWFAREIVADFEADLDKKIVIKKYIFQVKEIYDDFLFLSSKSSNGKTENLSYDEFAKYCKKIN